MVSFSLLLSLPPPHYATMHYSFTWPLTPLASLFCFLLHPLCTTAPLSPLAQPEHTAHGAPLAAADDGLLARHFDGAMYHVLPATTASSSNSPANRREHHRADYRRGHAADGGREGGRETGRQTRDMRETREILESHLREDDERHGAGAGVGVGISAGALAAAMAEGERRSLPRDPAARGYQRVQRPRPGQTGKGLHSHTLILAHFPTHHTVRRFRLSDFQTLGLSRFQALALSEFQTFTLSDLRAGETLVVKAAVCHGCNNTCVITRVLVCPVYLVHLVCLVCLVSCVSVYLCICVCGFVYGFVYVHVLCPLS